MLVEISHYLSDGFGSLPVDIYISRSLCGLSHSDLDQMQWFECFKQSFVCIEPLFIILCYVFPIKLRTVNSLKKKNLIKLKYLEKKVRLRKTKLRKMNRFT